MSSTKNIQQVLVLLELRIAVQPLLHIQQVLVEAIIFLTLKELVQTLL